MGRNKKPDPIAYCLVCGANVFSETDCVCGSCSETYGSSDVVVALRNKVRMLEDKLMDEQDKYQRLSASIEKSLKSIEKQVVKGK